MVLVKATEESEKGFLATTVGKFNEELVKAGIVHATDGLKPSSHGKRIALDGTGRTVIDGPFAETREPGPGFWLWEVKDMDGVFRDNQNPGSATLSNTPIGCMPPRRGPLSIPPAAEGGGLKGQDLQRVVMGRRLMTGATNS